MDYRKLNEKIDEMQDEILETIQRSIQINSVAGEPEENAPYGPGPKKALDFALDLGKSLGFRVGNVDNHAGYIEYGEGEEMAAVLGHMDVVPAGEGWKYPPFEGEIHDGIMYGRGVLDDKGPTIGAIYALKAIRDLGLPLDRRIRVIFGTNEERGSSCIQYYVDHGEEQPVMGITPDAEYPLIFFEKGMFTASCGYEEVKQGKIRVLEFQAGTAFNVVPSQCRLVLEGDHVIPETEGVTVTRENGTTVLTAEGIGAHGSTPELGKNAVILLMDAVKNLEVGGDYEKLFSFLRMKIGRETNGKSLGIYYQDDETGETTVNLGVVQGNAERIKFILDIRYPKNGNKEEIFNHLTQALDEAGMKLLDYDHTEMLYVPKDSELIQKLMKVYREGTGQMDAQPKAIGGGTYAKMFKNMVAFGPIFPGDPDVVHQPNEAIEVEKLMQSVKLVAAAMAEMGKK
nr:dipeptidase PepV [uncultured Merdimonas sp.]